MVNREMVRVITCLFAMQYSAFAFSECDQSFPIFHCNASEKICELVDKFVRDDKGYKGDEYIIDQQKWTFHGNAVVWVVHCDDILRICTSDKSFALYIDASRNIITDELSFQ